jgi:PKD repeat protein
VSYMRVLAYSALMALVGLAGCPGTGGGGSALTAKIGVSATHGTAPLRVAFSGDSSTSGSGSIVRYSWDFAGLGTGDGVNTEFRFLNPGLYTVTLTIENEAGDIDTAEVDVQVQGTTAQAAIAANRTSGAAPLVVSFDGTGSTAVDDTIRDYYWDFGDGLTSRESKPVHTYSRSGEFSAVLRVVSAGGVEDTAELSITVSDAAESSLQFNGSQFATLSVDAPAALGTFTFEAFVKAESEGGTVVSFGSPAVSLELVPSANLVRLRLAGTAFEGTTALAAGRWTFVAISYDKAVGATVYVGTLAALSAPFTADVTVGDLSLGAGWRGNLGRVRFWSVARDAAEIAADASGGSSADPGDLLGEWPIDDGAGQTLRNRVTGGAAGTRGASAASEAADPAWSSDAP